MKKLILKTAITVFVLFSLFRFVDLKYLLSVYKNTRLDLIAAAVCLQYLMVFIRTCRWNIILGSFDVKRPLYELFFIYFIGSFFTYFTPGGAGNDIYRASKIFKHAGGKKIPIASVLLERGTNLLVIGVLAVLAVCFLFFALRGPDLNRLLFEYVVMLTAIFVALFFLSYIGTKNLMKIDLPESSVFGRLANKLRRLFDTMYSLFSKKKKFLEVILWGLAFYLVLSVYVFLIGMSLGIRAQFFYYLLFVPLISIAVNLPFTISGLGMREFTFLLLFGLLGVDGTKAVAVGFMMYIVGMVSLSPGFLVYLLLDGRGAE